MDKLSTSKGIRCFEALLEILVKLIGISIVYAIVNWLGQFMLGSDFQQDTLLSLLLLPAIYVLRDLLTIIEPYFVIVEKSQNFVSVTYGITPRIIDTLELHSVDNIEVLRTPLGYLFNYGTIRLYGRGGQVEMPFVFNAEQVSKTLNIGRQT